MVGKNISGCAMEAKEERGAHIWQSQWRVKYSMRCNQLLVAYGIQAQSNANIISVGLQKET